MKKLVFIIAFFTVCITAKAQMNKDTVGLNVPVKDGQVIYTGVVLAEGKTKGDLYRNAQQWFIDNFSSQKNVIQDKDDEGALVFGRGIYYFSSGVRLETVNWANNMTIKIECKDNKYRYSFYSMAIKSSDSGNFDIEQVLGALLGTQKWQWSKNAAKNLLIQNDSAIKSAILSLKNAMAKTTTDF